MTRHILPTFGIILAGCVTHSEKGAFAPVSGRYACSVLGTDTRQLQQLASARRDIGGTVDMVEAVGPNRVRVQSGHYVTGGWTGIAFFAVRQGGIWRIDEHTRFEKVRTETVVVN